MSSRFSSVAASLVHKLFWVVIFALLMFGGIPLIISWKTSGGPNWDAWMGELAGNRLSITEWMIVAIVFLVVVWILASVTVMLIKRGVSREHS